MKKIDWLVTRVNKYPLTTAFLGACGMYLLDRINLMSTHQEFVKVVRLDVVVACLSMVLLQPSCSLFYGGSKKIEDLTPDYFPGRAKFRIPDVKYFPLTMDSNIGLARKIAGYIHQIITMTLFLSMGAFLYALISRV